MAIKDLLVVCDSGPASTFRMESCFSLAKVFSAHVTGIHLMPSPLIPVYGIAYPEVTTLSYAAADQIQEFEDNAIALEKEFDGLALKHGISASWKKYEGIDINFIIENARYADILVTPQGYSRYGETTYHRFNDYLCTYLGRPILMIPDLKKVFSLPKKIIIAWSESQEAARAVHDALPFLHMADEVQIVYAAKTNNAEKVSMIFCDDLRLHLSRHGINSDVFLPDSSAKGVGKTLIDTALEFDADLIVMGAYGHSRMREIVLGGATKYLLENTAIPLLLSN